MKIGEAQQMYAKRLQNLYTKQNELNKKKESLLEQADQGIDNKEDISAILELSKEVQKRIDSTSKISDQIGAISNVLRTVEETNQSTKAMEKAFDDEAKCLEIARRISRGDKVPESDERKLMEYNKDIYMMAKNSAMLHMYEKHKKHKSLWEDEEELKQKTGEEISEEVNNQEISLPSVETFSEVMDVDIDLGFEE